jgi:hypothetical protein
VPCCLFGLGSPEEGDFEPVSGQENWDHSFDISDKEEGKYNLIVRGIDDAGNVSYEGPYNVYIDPASDLPVVHISNPSPGMRVGNSLNVVGTCVDDDVVRRVEVRLDDGPFMEADGQEFWSQALDVGEIADGQHTLTVRGVDIHDVVGVPQSVSFQLDKKAPSIEIVSHRNGALVAGKILIEGWVDDENEVASLALSLDGGATYESLKIDRGKDTTRGEFARRLDTEDFEDGPRIFRFRGIDRTGSTGFHAFLLFINNDAPVLEVFSPAEEESVNGKVRISGRAIDKIGLRSLSYFLGGGEGGPIDLIPGDPYWTTEVDLQGRKSGNITIELTLENLTGNQTTERLRLRVDDDLDLPVVTIDRPRMGDIIYSDVVVSGFAEDDDAVEGVEITIDEGNPVFLPAEAAYLHVYTDLEPGQHTLAARAKDAYGVYGLLNKIVFQKAGRVPSVSLDRIIAGESDTAFHPGILLPPETRGKLSGHIRFAGRGITAEYNLQDGTPKKLSLKKAEEQDVRLFDIALPKELPVGRVDLFISATDDFGSTTSYRSFFFNASSEDGEGILLFDSRIDEDNNVLLTDGAPLFGYMLGEAIRSIELDPPSDVVTVSAEGSVLKIEAKTSGVGEPTRLKVSSSAGRTYTSEPLTFVTDSRKPDLTITSPRLGDWVKESLVLEGTVVDGSGILSLGYTVDNMDTFLPIPMEEGPQGGSFSRTVSLAPFDDGAFTLIVSATDGAGNTSYVVIPFRKDSLPPAIQLVTPRAVDEVNGLITIIGRVEDDGIIESVEFSDDGQTYRPIGSGRSFTYDLNLSGYPDLPESFFLRATDASQNSGQFSPDLNINPSADKPMVEIQIPKEGQVVRADLTMSGMVFDDDRVKSVYYRLDGGEPIRMEGGSNFSIPLAIDSISDNRHTVEVTAEDIGGLMSDTMSTSFVVSKSEPESALDSPRIDEHVKGVIVLEGRSWDPNGIGEAGVSFDNGHTFNRVRGMEEWEYRLDTRMLADGTQALLVKAADKTGVEGLFTTTINIDNSAPEILLDEPKDGQIVTGHLRLEGRAHDNIALSSLTASIIPIEEDQEETLPSVTYPLSTEGIFSKEIALSGSEPGWYNLKIEAIDRADNVQYLSRIILVQESSEADKIELLFPAEGSTLSGLFTLSGRVESQSLSQLSNVSILIDDRILGSAPIRENGYFSLDIGPEDLAAGEHRFAVEAIFSRDSRLRSEDRIFRYARVGPWIKISSFNVGDFVAGRPFLEGEAGYYLDPVAESDEEALRRYEETQKRYAVRQVEVSFDNGRSFRRADGKGLWKYRLETQDIPNGKLRVLVKALFSQDRTAITQSLLQVDTKAPELAILNPEEGNRFNERLDVTGTARDVNGLQEVSVALRQGDKSRYAVPKFIQGSYLDSHMLGATYADLGLGLTFFDDNVKLQLQIGVSPPGRFSGLVIGAKLLANIAVLPFSYFFGPSWDFFSMSLAIGANFSYFTMSEGSIAFTEEGLVLAAIVGQIEFARFHIASWRMFHTYSLYTEGQLWFISSDVSAGLEPRITFGLRIGIF